MIYLDHAATAPVLPQAAEAALQAMTARFGNPSSGHALGRDALQLLSQARASVASVAGCRPEQLLFTSGGTESNAMAIASALAAKASGEIVATALEHPSVLEALKAAKPKGFALKIALPDRQGRVSPDCIAALATRETVLVCCMAVCNQTGAALDVNGVAEAIADICPSAWLHCDAVQAVGAMPLPSKAHSLSLSGHKIGAPKGVGALVFRKRIRPLWRGGGQEWGLRPGTENLPGIAAFGAAARNLPDAAALSALKEYALHKISEIPSAVVVPPHDAPHIIAFAVPPLPAEVWVRKLSDAGFCLSAGAACAGGKESRLLRDMKLPPLVVTSAIRLSLGKGNTAQDIDALAACLAEMAPTV